MSADTVPLEDALDRQLAALTQAQLAALRGETPGSRQAAKAGERSATERSPARHSRETFKLVRKLGRGLRHLVKRG